LYVHTSIAIVHSFLEVSQHYPGDGPLNDPRVSRSEGVGALLR
jgi:hypothetical protein